MDSTQAPLPCGLYARISDEKNDQEHLGIERQVKDCADLATRKGWAIAAEYREPNISATRSKERPQYERMLGDIRSGRIRAVVVWDVDRLSRTPRELEDIIDMADRYGLELASVGGEIDLSTPQGRMMARIKGTVARHETDQLSRRVTRKLQENAKKGQVHAPVAYGYKRVVERDERDRKVRSYDVINEAEKAVLVESAERILRGESIRSVAADLNRRKVPVPRNAKRWDSTSLRGMLLRERNVGKRSYRGQVIADAQWPALWDQARHDQLVALLTAPDRRTNYVGRTKKHLLTGIARCGKCDGTMVVATPHASNSLNRGYVCGDCRGVRRAMAQVDEWVESVMIERLLNPRALDHLIIGDPTEVQRAEAERDAAMATMAVAADKFGRREWTVEQLDRINAINMPIVQAQQAIIDANMPLNLPMDIAGPAAEENWSRATLDQKQALIRALIRITILPSGGGRRKFDRDLIRIDPVEDIA